MMTTVSAVIYGDNNIVEMEDVTNPLIQQQGKAVAGVFSTYGSVERSLELLFTNPRNLVDRMTCEYELYTNQPISPVATAFLIAPNKVMTVGHAITSSQKCRDNTVFIFNFEWNSAEQAINPIDKSDAYGCKGILKFGYGEIDYEIIELDREVVGVTPLELDFESKVEKGEELYTIGHSLQLPKKYTTGFIRSTEGISENYYTAEIDTFRGNSGSPVFSAKTNKVIGILKDGEYDFDWDEANFCNFIKVCESGTCRGEAITRMDKLKDYVQL